MSIFRRKKFLLVVIALLAVAILVPASYCAYVLIDYFRIEDNVALDVVPGAEVTEKLPAAETGKTYTIVTYNVGFGAYTPDYTFFMDGGKESRARSAESVRDCLAGAADTVEAYTPDFIFLQELDTDSQRAQHVDNVRFFTERFSKYESVYAENYHSSYLFYPFSEPIGAAKSGILTLTRCEATSGLRRRFPISESFSKFVDLDRCYSVTRIPVEDGRELVLFNLHCSAYGAGDDIKSQQLRMVFGDMQAEYEKGNYVVCGGDFNADFTGDSVKNLNGYDVDPDLGWAQPFPAETLPANLRRVTEYTNGASRGTARNDDVPYQEGNFTIIVDGFVVSDNVEVDSLKNIQTGYAYSDHNPVVMQFKLK